MDFVWDEETEAVRDAVRSFLAEQGTFANPTFDPVAKPGVLGFRDLVLATFPGTRNLGIGRVCEAEGVSGQYGTGEDAQPIPPVPATTP